MADIGIFPTLPGLAWPVTKTPVFQTRIQRAISGRELRARDYPFPLWKFSLDFDFLRDLHNAQALNAAYDELRTLMGFVMTCNGAFGTFLFSDPTDNTVSGQALPGAFSAVTSVAPSSPGVGSSYVVSDVLTLIGGAFTQAATFLVTSVNGSGGITGLSIINGGQYQFAPDPGAIFPLSGGSGTGASATITWITTVQLQRTVGTLLPITSALAEQITASVSSGPNPVTVNTPGTGYAVNQQLLVPIGMGVLATIGGRSAQFTVSSIGAGGSITGLSVSDVGLYATIPGTVNVPLVGGSGTGTTVNINWSTSAALLVTATGGGGFAEPITAPNVVSAVYFSGIPQYGWTIDPTTGIITLGTVPFVAAYRLFAYSIVAGGASYQVNDVVVLAGGVLYTGTGGGSTTTFVVTAVTAQGNITGLQLTDTGRYNAPPGIESSVPLGPSLVPPVGVNDLTLTGGHGDNAVLNVIWGTQPLISADFTYFFRCRFVDDAYSFDNFLLSFWDTKKLTFISVRP